MTSVADFIVEALRGEGVRTIFGVPGGGGNLDLIDAARRIDLPFVLTTTETGAVIAAVAQAEISGSPGACLTTLGPGAASAVNGVACAFLERAPVFVFTDCYPASAREYQHQRVYHLALFRTITRFSESLAPDPAQTMGQAVSDAFNEPGPVHIDCPGDLMSSEAPKAFQWLKGSGGEVDRATRAKIEPLIRASTKPLLIAGLGARRPDEVAAVRAFCERFNVPAMVTYKAKGVVPDDHRWCAGVFTNGAIERPFIDGCDLIIAAGLDPVEFLARTWPYKQPVLYCGRYLRDGFGQMPVTAILTGIPRSLQVIGETLSRSTWIHTEAQANVDAMRRAIDIQAPGLTSQQLVRTAAARLGDRYRVTVDAGAHMFAATMLWRVREPNQMLISNGLSTMGFALPAAIGAAVLERGRPVAALTGDGGLLMCLGEFATVARERLPIMTIVLNDASLSLIEIKQQARKLAPAGVALGDVKWPALAQGFGIPAWTAKTMDELDRAIESATKVDGPTLVEARIDRSNYGETMKAIRG